MGVSRRLAALIAVALVATACGRPASAPPRALGVVEAHVVGGDPAIDCVETYGCLDAGSRVNIVVTDRKRLVVALIPSRVGGVARVELIPGEYVVRVGDDLACPQRVDLAGASVQRVELLWPVEGPCLDSLPPGPPIGSPPPPPGAR